MAYRRLNTNTNKRRILSMRRKVAKTKMMAKWWMQLANAFHRFSKFPRCLLKSNAKPANANLETLKNVAAHELGKVQERVNARHRLYLIGNNKQKLDEIDSAEKAIRLLWAEYRRLKTIEDFEGFYEKVNEFNNDDFMDHLLALLDGQDGNGEDEAVQQTMDLEGTNTA